MSNATTCFIIVISICLLQITRYHCIDAQEEWGINSLAGSDYGDIIDDLRKQVDRVVHHTNQDDNSQVTRIRTLLTNIQQDLSQEKSIADQTWMKYYQDHQNQTQSFNQSITLNRVWLDHADRIVSINTPKLANLTIWLQRRLPRMIARKTQELAIVEVELKQEQVKRDRANMRYRSREQQARDTMAGVLHVFDALIGVNITDAIDAEKREIKSAGSITDVQLKLQKLMKEIHDFITMITKTEVMAAVNWNQKRATLETTCTLLNNTLSSLHNQMSSTNTTINDITKQLTFIATHRNARVLELARSTRILNKLNIHYPKIHQQYVKSNQERQKQLESITQMLKIVQERYYQQVNTTKH